MPHADRSLLLGGDFFLGGVVAATLAKLVLRLRVLGSPPAAAVNRTAADTMLVRTWDWLLCRHFTATIITSSD